MKEIKKASFKPFESIVMPEGATILESYYDFEKETFEVTYEVDKPLAPTEEASK